MSPFLLDGKKMRLTPQGVQGAWCRTRLDVRLSDKRDFPLARNSQGKTIKRLKRERSVKTEEESKRSRKVTIRLRDSEYRRLHAQFSTTTKRKFSDYLRSMLLNKRITVYTRDRSLDELVGELLVLRRELSAIGNNYNQSVKRLHTLDRIPEIKLWALVNEKGKETFVKKVEEINQKIAQISARW